MTPEEKKEVVERCRELAKRGSKTWRNVAKATIHGDAVDWLQGTLQSEHEQELRDVDPDERV